MNNHRPTSPSFSTAAAMNLHPDSQAEQSASTGTNTAPAAPGLTAEMNAEIDAAMRHLDASDAAARASAASQPAKQQHDPRPSQSGSKGPAHIRGPRVVQAGREHRTGKVITVGPTDIFV